MTTGIVIASDVEIGMIPNSSITSGCQLPATFLASQVRVVVSTMIGLTHGKFAKLISLIALVNPAP
jgi:hypothetical protein